MTTPEIDVEAETDRLYQLPLDEFVEARNALAARLKLSGDKESAARVKALARPSVPAWATNQAYWTARQEFDALLASTKRLQSAQAEGVAGEALREAMKARREAQAAVLARAEKLLVGAGHGANPGTLRKVSDTLEALAVEGARPENIRAGRLVQDLQPPGFEAFAAMANIPSPAPGQPPRLQKTTASPGPRALGTAEPKRSLEGAPSRKGEPNDETQEEALEQARAALAEAEKRLERARREAGEATGAQSIAEKRAEGARGELDEATRRFERAKERAARTAADETAARQEAERLAAEREEAETARDAALRAVRALE